MEAAYGPEARAEVEQLLRAFEGYLAEPVVTVAFCGRFSSGKSTLLNALIGEELLPTSIYAETGAHCRIQSGGPRRVTVVRNDGSEQRVPATRDAIAEAITLTDLDGALRPEVGGVAEVRIVLPDAPVQAGTRWVDSPGADDGLERPATDDPAPDDPAPDADVLVWVTRSDAMLALTEKNALGQWVRTHGAAGCVLVVNIILDEATPQRFAELVDGRIGVGLRRRASDAAERVGAVIAPPVLVAARAAASGRSGFGAEQLHLLLSDEAGLWSRATHTRLSTVEAMLRTVAEEMSHRIEQLRVEYAATQKRAVAAAAERADRDARFRAGLVDSARSESDACAARIRTAAAEQAEAVALEAAASAEGCAAELVDAVTRQVESYVRAVVVSAVRAAPVHDRTACGDLPELASDLVPSVGGITTSLRPPSGGGGVGTTVGVVVGGVVGTLFGLPLVGAAVGASVGGGLGAGAIDQRRKEHAALREEIVSAGKAAAKQVRRTAVTLADRVTEACPPRTGPPEPPDDRQLRALSALRDQLLAPLAAAVERTRAEVTPLATRAG
jgi:hypothetical protein